MVAAKEDNGGMNDYEMRMPNDESKWVSFKKLFYDRETKAVLGRTGKSWAQLLTFYTIFYIVLAALFAICMQGLFATLSDTEPTWRLERSLIGTNPGLGFRPISNRTEEGSLIAYNMTNTTEVAKWVHLINDFLKPYKQPQTGDNYVNCDFNKPPPPGKVCVTDLSQLRNCNADRSFGYTTASPCIFLKLNRIFDWIPEYHTSAAEGMPDDLVTYINSTSEDEKKQIWVSCKGQYDVDKENVQGFNYYPRGFAGYYYPYRNVKNYLSPIIAVEIKNLTPNRIVTIECQAWAKNIEYSSSMLTRSGSVQFDVQVDAPFPLPLQVELQPIQETNATAQS